MKKIFVALFVTILTVFCLAVPACCEETESRLIDLSDIVIPLVKLMVSALVCLGSGMILPRLRTWICAKTNVEQRKLIWEATVHFVEAAEQVIGRGFGKKKFEYVRSALEEAGFTVDENLIEAAVREMNQNSLDALRDAVLPECSEDEDAPHEDDGE